MASSLPLCRDHGVPCWDNDTCPLCVEKYGCVVLSVEPEPVELEPVDAMLPAPTPAPKPRRRANVSVLFQDKTPLFRPKKH